MADEAVGLESIAHRTERLLGEHVALETNAGKARLQRERVHEREDDEVVFVVRRPEKVPRVVVDHGDARILYG